MAAIFFISRVVWLLRSDGADDTKRRWQESTTWKGCVARETRADVQRRRPRFVLLLCLARAGNACTRGLRAALRACVCVCVCECDAIMLDFSHVSVSAMCDARVSYRCIRVAVCECCRVARWFVDARSALHELGRSARNFADGATQSTAK